MSSLWLLLATALNLGLALTAAAETSRDVLVPLELTSPSPVGANMSYNRRHQQPPVPAIIHVVWTKPRFVLATCQ